MVKTSNLSVVSINRLIENAIYRLISPYIFSCFLYNAAFSTHINK